MTLHTKKIKKVNKNQTYSAAVAGSCNASTPNYREIERPAAAVISAWIVVAELGPNLAQTFEWIESSP